MRDRHHSKHQVLGTILGGRDTKMKIDMISAFIKPSASQGEILYSDEYAKCCEQEMKWRKDMQD